MIYIIYSIIVTVAILILYNKIYIDKAKKRKIDELVRDFYNNRNKFYNKPEYRNLPDSDNIPLKGEFLVSRYAIYRDCHIKSMTNGKTYITLPIYLHQLLYGKDEIKRSEYPVRLYRQPDYTIDKCWYFVSEKYTMSDILKYSKVIIDDLYNEQDRLEKMVDSAVDNILGKNESEDK